MKLKIKIKNGEIKYNVHVIIQYISKNDILSRSFCFVTAAWRVKLCVRVLYS